VDIDSAGADAFANINSLLQAKSKTTGLKSLKQRWAKVGARVTPAATPNSVASYDPSYDVEPQSATSDFGSPTRTVDFSMTSPLPRRSPAQPTSGHGAGWVSDRSASSQSLHGSSVDSHRSRTASEFSSSSPSKVGGGALVPVLSASGALLTPKVGDDLQDTNARARLHQRSRKVNPFYKDTDLPLTNNIALVPSKWERSKGRKKRDRDAPSAAAILDGNAGADDEEDDDDQRKRTVDRKLKHPMLYGIYQSEATASLIHSIGTDKGKDLNDPLHQPELRRKRSMHAAKPPKYSNAINDDIYDDHDDEEEDGEVKEESKEPNSTTQLALPPPKGDKQLNSLVIRPDANVSAAVRDGSPLVLTPRMAARRRIYQSLASCKVNPLSDYALYDWLRRRAKLGRVRPPLLPEEQSGRHAVLFRELNARRSPFKKDGGAGAAAIDRQVDMADMVQAMMHRTHLKLDAQQARAIEKLFITHFGGGPASGKHDANHSKAQLTLQQFMSRFINSSLEEWEKWWKHQQELANHARLQPMASMPRPSSAATRTPLRPSTLSSLPSAKSVLPLPLWVPAYHRLKLLEVLMNHTQDKRRPSLPPIRDTQHGLSSLQSASLTLTDLWSATQKAVAERLENFHDTSGSIKEQITLDEERKFAHKLHRIFTNQLRQTMDDEREKKLDAWEEEEEEWIRRMEEEEDKAAATRVEDRENAGKIRAAVGLHSPQALAAQAAAEAAKPDPLAPKPSPVLKPSLHRPNSSISISSSLSAASASSYNAAAQLLQLADSSKSSNATTEPKGTSDATNSAMITSHSREASTESPKHDAAQPSASDSTSPTAQPALPSPIPTRSAVFAQIGAHVAATEEQRQREAEEKGLLGPRHQRYLSLSPEVVRAHRRDPSRTPTQRALDVIFTAAHGVQPRSPSPTRSHSVGNLDATPLIADIFAPLKDVKVAAAQVRDDALRQQEQRKKEEEAEARTLAAAKAAAEEEARRATEPVAEEDESNEDDTAEVEVAKSEAMAKSDNEAATVDGTDTGTLQASSSTRRNTLGLPVGVGRRQTAPNVAGLLADAQTQIQAQVPKGTQRTRQMSLILPGERTRELEQKTLATVLEREDAIGDEGEDKANEEAEADPPSASDFAIVITDTAPSSSPASSSPEAASMPDPSAPSDLNLSMTLTSPLDIARYNLGRLHAELRKRHDEEMERRIDGKDEDDNGAGNDNATQSSPDGSENEDDAASDEHSSIDLHVPLPITFDFASMPTAALESAVSAARAHLKQIRRDAGEISSDEEESESSSSSDESESESEIDHGSPASATDLPDPSALSAHYQALAGLRRTRPLAGRDSGVAKHVTLKSEGTRIETPAEEAARLLRELGSRKLRTNMDHRNNRLSLTVEEAAAKMPISPRVKRMSVVIPPTAAINGMTRSDGAPPPSRMEAKEDERQKQTKLPPIASSADGSSREHESNGNANGTQQKDNKAEKLDGDTDESESDGSDERPVLVVMPSITISPPSPRDSLAEHQSPTARTPPSSDPPPPAAANVNASLPLSEPTSAQSSSAANVASASSSIVEASNSSESSSTSTPDSASASACDEFDASPPSAYRMSSLPLPSSSSANSSPISNNNPTELGVSPRWERTPDVEWDF